MIPPLTLQDVAICPGGAVELCISVCPGTTVRVYGACVQVTCAPSSHEKLYGPICRAVQTGVPRQRGRGELGNCCNRADYNLVLLKSLKQ